MNKKMLGAVLLFLHLFSMQKAYQVGLNRGKGNYKSGTIERGTNLAAMLSSSRALIGIGSTGTFFSILPLDVVKMIIRYADTAMMTKYVIAVDRRIGLVIRRCHNELQYDDSFICKLMIERYKNQINVTDDLGRSLLHWAAEQGHISMVQMLLQAGASKDKSAKDGTTALHQAAAFGYATIVQMLLQAGADKDKVDVHGKSPLFWASANHHAEVVQILTSWTAKDKSAKK